MKINKFLALFIFISFGIVIFSQQNQKQQASNTPFRFVGLKYKMKYGQRVYYVDDSMKVRQVSIWSKKLFFDFLNENVDSVFLKFKPISFEPKNLKYKEDDKIQNDISNPDYTNFVNQGNNDKLFFLLKKKYNSYSYRYTAFTTGTLILPIKIRFRVDSFPVQASPDVSIGPFIGYQWVKKDFHSEKENMRSHTISGFAAPGMIALNSSNSTDTLIKNSTNFGLSVGFGYLYEINKFQMGLFVGYDFIFGDPAKTWIYQPGRNSNKPWISVAIGFPFRKE
jgi:hypothetical protein